MWARYEAEKEKADVVKNQRALRCWDLMGDSPQKMDEHGDKG